MTSPALTAARAILAPHIEGYLDADPDAAAESLASAWATLEGELFHSDLSAHQILRRAGETTQARAERLIDAHLRDQASSHDLWSPRLDRVAIEVAYSWGQA